MHRLFALLLLLGPTATPAIHSAPDHPNVVFILADDLGYRELGCYGQEKIRTPRIDGLASEGMRFTRAYSGSPVCAPSRCVLLTGRHPGHAVVRDNRATQPEGQFPLPPEEMTLAEALRPAGYRCGAFGKWGLGNVESTGQPNRQGFDRFFGYLCQAHAHTYYPASLWSDGELFPLNNDPPIPGHAGLPPGADPSDPASYEMFEGQDYAPDRINEAALDFIRKNQDRPFFLYYPTIIPHVALHVPREELEPYLALGWEDPPFTRDRGYGYTPHFTPRAAYAAMITRMDRYVGRILDLLDELDLSDDTIVVFTSDNGTTHLGDEVDYEFFRNVGSLRGLKGSLYEGGIRVPLIVKWPGVVEPGSSTEFVTGFEDWFPTLVEICGGTPPEQGVLDGVSLLPTLKGAKQPERSFLYREFPGYGGQQAVWIGEWKGIRQNMLRKRNPSPLQTELYQLAEDESETRDLASAHPEVVEKIEAIMKKERSVSVDFPFPPIDR